MAFPWLPDGAIKHQIKFSFKFGRQTLWVDNGKSGAEARLDILLEKDGRQVAIMELKRPGLVLTDDDGAQGLSYARLVEPPAPLVVVTNGKAVRILETASGNSWQPSTASDKAFQSLLVQASRVASADIRHAIDTLMGTDPRIWVQAIRHVSAAAIAELTASWDEPALPFAADFLAPREATQQLMKYLGESHKLLMLSGPPLSGKSNVLRELFVRTEGSDAIVILYVEAGVGGGVLQALADAIARALDWPVSPEEARAWLRRVAAQDGVRMVVAVDGLQADDTTSLREIEDLSSSAFGPSLSVVLAGDDTVTERLLKSPSQRSPSPLGRRSTLVPVDRLSDREFNAARALLAQGRILLMPGAEMAFEYREPWVLGAMHNFGQAALKGKAEDRALTLPSLLGPELLSMVRERFAHAHELRRMFCSLAHAMLADAEDSRRPYELVLRQGEIGLIRRAAVEAELVPDDLRLLIDHGFVRPEMDDAVGPTILVRFPALLASEMAHVLAEEIGSRAQSDVDDIASWIAGAASNLPLGEVVIAQAIADAAKRRSGVTLGLITALLNIPPEREVLDGGRRYAMLLPDDRTVDIEFRPGGNGSVVIEGEEYELDLGDQEQVTYKNIHPWLILSHMACIPFEVMGPEGAIREDPNLLLEIGTCPLPLKAPRGTQSMRMLPTKELSDGTSFVLAQAGVIEPVTLGILNYLSVPGKPAEQWIETAADSGSVHLLARAYSALGMLVIMGTHAASAWAKDQMNGHILPSFRNAIAAAQTSSPSAE
ncbi:hypothetical protein GN316_19270 [Xylophilus sp. Kf1]|nr:hypothetical protein [Xylophilus sp. Kf1]